MLPQSLAEMFDIFLVEQYVDVSMLHQFQIMICNNEVNTNLIKNNPRDI